MVKKNDAVVRWSLSHSSQKLVKFESAKKTALMAQWVDMEALEIKFKRLYYAYITLWV